MRLESPDLDTRDFQTLVTDARSWIERHASGWTDLSPGDPGIVLVELFAYLTDMMIYRLNRLPEKAYVEFLRLLGAKIAPPAAATATLRFERTQAGDQAIEIPRGTRVTASASGAGRAAPVFVTARPATLAAGAESVEVLAHDCELVEGELVGHGTGQPGLSVTAKQPPIVAATGYELDLVVGVETAPGELHARDPAIEFGGKGFRVWTEVDSFARAGDDAPVYVVDRLNGTITFAPAVRLPANGTAEDAARALGAVPPAGREIRLWYRRGGGEAGNVVAGALTVLKDEIPGVRVSNPAPAIGGRDPETLENALIRGPQDVLAVEAAVRAADYEAIARLSSGAVARAKAFTRSSLWRHATAGTVDVLLVPFVEGASRISAEEMQQHEAEPVRAQVLAALNERRPLGTSCFVNWTRYKTVRIAARLVVRREENLEAVKQRVEDRLYQTITPLPTDANVTGWRFGQPLRVANVFDIILKEPGVRFADTVRLIVDEVPGTAVKAITADAFQPHTWYAGSESILFRSLNDGEGWEAAGRFPGERIRRVRAHPGRPGLIAVIGSLAEGGSRIHVSHDAGETWDEEPSSTAFEIEDAAWLDRGGDPVLLLATDVGLYELPWSGDRIPVQVIVTPNDQARGFYSVVVSTDFRDVVTVAVAAQDGGGVFLSSRGGAPDTFRPVGLTGEDVRTLAVQRDGPRAFLWAGVASIGAGDEDPGRGTFRWELRGDDDPPEGWQGFAANWNGGSCWSIAFQGTRVLAATHHAGVVRLDPDAAIPQWQGLEIEAGVPTRDPGTFLFLQVDDIATDPQGTFAIAAGERGVYRSDDGGANYRSVCAQEFDETVTLPDTWLFTSGEHELSVVGEDEAAGH
jgi:hypothetical protein